MRDKIGKQIDSLLSNSTSSNYSESGSDAGIKRIILCRLGGIGDVIHTLPLAKHLKKKYKNASIEYITSANVSYLLNNSCSFIDKTWAFNKKNSSKAASDILSDKTPIDYFFNLHGSLRFFLFNLFNVKAKKYFHYKKEKDLHSVVNFAKTFDSDISAHNLESKTLTVDENKSILNDYGLKENKYICFVVGVGKVRPHRAWAIENWVMLAKKILSICDPDLKIVFLGGEDEEKLSGYFSSFGERTIDLIGKLDLIEVSKIINSSTTIISGDTGLIHIASALSKKVVGIFGPTIPERSGPFTGDFDILKAKNCICIGDLKSCKKKTNSGLCMESISVDDVISKLQIGSLSYQ